MAEVLYLVDMCKCQHKLLGVVLASLSGIGTAAAQTQPLARQSAASPATAASDPAVAPIGTGDGSSTAMSPGAPSSVLPAPSAVPPRQESPPPPPTINLQKDPPLPPPVARTDRVHDGFYARLSLGFGNLGATMNAPDSGAVEGDGSTLALDAALGYAVSPGIVLGGALMMESLPSASLALGRSGATGTSDISAGLFGPFFDGYPNARGGLHLGGAVGLASTRVQRPEEAAGFKKAGGFGLAGWIGYDMWVAEQWSAGLMLRLMGTRTKGDAEATANNEAGSATMATQSVALMLTGVYN